jgi:Two component regulator propeller
MNMIFVLSILTIFASCNEGKPTFSETPTEKVTTKMMSDTLSSGIGKNIDCVLQDKHGNYWLASNGEGVYRYDGKTWKHFTKKDGLCADFVWNINEDVNGIVWFSTRDGFCAYNGIFFTDYTDVIKNAPKEKLHYSKGGLFFNHLNGICFYDGKSFSNFVIHPDHYKPAPNDRNRPYSIYSTLVDKAGNVWFGTQSQGVCRYDGTTFSYLTDKNLAGPAVRAMYQDHSGNLWFGNNGGGLFRYDGKTLSNVTEEKGLGNPEFLQGIFNDKVGTLARVWAINEDREGNLWVGTIDAGLWKFDGKNWTNYTTKEGLLGNAIWAISKDNLGELWFVINGETICKFDGKAFVKFDIQSSLRKY